MNRHATPLFLALLLVPLLAGSTPAKKGETEEVPSWKAGVAAVKITPHRPMPMSGYAARKSNPSEGTEQDLFAKALAIEDGEGHRAVIVTTDLIGIRDQFRQDTEKAAKEKFGLPPHALFMNASHTHCGPSYGRDDTKDYYDILLKKVIDIIGKAIQSMEPANLAYSHAKCSFAMNRRTPTEKGYRNHPNPDGVVDHTVPVLSVKSGSENSELKAVVFGYSCHNTNMGFMKWLGDYAGYAQEYFEADHPGVTALFVNGCGADQNPYPRSELFYAQRHGRSLATAVEAALETNQRSFFHQRKIEGPLTTLFDRVSLDYTEESGREPLAYPVQLLQFGDDLSLITLGNEVVVDYSLRLKKELGGHGPAIWVAGYSNSYGGYIPSKRVLLEGGYEAKRPWKPDIEERIVTKVREQFDRANSKVKSKQLPALSLRISTFGTKVSRQSQSQLPADGFGPSPSPADR